MYCTYVMLIVDKDFCVALVFVIDGAQIADQSGVKNDGMRFWKDEQQAPANSKIL